MFSFNLFRAFNRHCIMKNSTSSDAFKNSDETTDFKMISEFIKKEIKTLTILHNNFITNFLKLEAPKDIQDIYVYDASKKQLCGKIKFLAKTYQDCGPDVEVEDAKSPIDALFALSEFLDFYQSQLAAAESRTELNKKLVEHAKSSYNIDKIIQDLDKKTLLNQSNFPSLCKAPLETIFESDETRTSQETWPAPEKQNELSLLGQSSWHFFSEATKSSENKSFDTTEFYNSPIEEIEQTYNIKTDKMESRYHFARATK